MQLILTLKNVKTAYLSEPVAGLYAVRYANGRLALQLASDQPLMTCTVNLPDAPCEPDEVYIKDYSENAGCVAMLQKAGVIGDSVGVWTSGHVGINRYKLTEGFKKLLTEVLA